MIQAVRPQAVLAPLLVGLAVQIHHLCRSKFIVETLHEMGFCSSYAEVIKFEKKIRLTVWNLKSSVEMKTCLGHLSFLLSIMLIKILILWMVKEPFIGGDHYRPHSRARYDSIEAVMETVPAITATARWGLFNSSFAMEERIFVWYHRRVICGIHSKDSNCDVWWVNSSDLR
jgi:hypothetical protein